LTLSEPLLEGNTDQSLTCSSRKWLAKTDIHSNGRQGPDSKQLSSSKSDEAKGPLEVVCNMLICLINVPIEKILF